ncbi:uncharacterized protein BDZ99DRAFT_219549 [Mytilinidion resinicola]|uniref:Secreted protein n=1 Tax=Mytilinidion resinicola TaxID=574789 RepID=A0A6A6XYW9_9PEZI|nr:uncharacterized protein BDZ99DRAFT_219549 [Mytilinidion resinicola]KAF2801579.1 hypothetical protein BDZ99DRAFT_219549 [Mytilinidion resinicola]
MHYTIWLGSLLLSLQMHLLLNGMKCLSLVLAALPCERRNLPFRLVRSPNPVFSDLGFPKPFELRVTHRTTNLDTVVPHSCRSIVPHIHPRAVPIQTIYRNPISTQILRTPITSIYRR